MTVNGHADGDSRVCSAVSAMAGTLYTSYDVDRPVPGVFVWNSKLEPSDRARELVFNFFRLLAHQYPQEISFQE